MSDDRKITDFVRAMAEQHGLTRALDKFPEGVKSGAERGLRPVGAMPAGHSPITHPAPIFSPARFEPEP